MTRYSLRELEPELVVDRSRAPPASSALENEPPVSSRAAGAASARKVFERRPTVKTRTCASLGAFCVTWSSVIWLPVSAPSESTTTEPALMPAAASQRDRLRDSVVEVRVRTGLAAACASASSIGSCDFVNGTSDVRSTALNVTTASRWLTFRCAAKRARGRRALRAIGAAASCCRSRRSRGPCRCSAFALVLGRGRP